MKKNILIAITMLFFMGLQTFAQQRNDMQVISWSSMNDTLILNFNDNQKILITARTFIEMPKQADSLLTLFLNDFENGVKQDSLLFQAKEVHYIIHPSGKRRMKYNNGLDENFNLLTEMKKLNLNIPEYGYHIYFNNTTIDIFINNPDQLTKVKTLELNQAIIEAKGHDKLINRNNTIKASLIESGKWNVDDKQIIPRYKAVVFGSNFGMLVFPNHVGPQLGLSLFYKYKNQFNQPLNAIGYSIDILAVKDYKDVSDYSSMQKSLTSHYWQKISFIRKIGENSIGLQYGWISDLTKQPYLLKGYTAGVTCHVKYIQYSLDIVTGSYRGFVFPAMCFGIKVGY